MQREQQQHRFRRRVLTGAFALGALALVLVVLQYRFDLHSEGLAASVIAPPVPAVATGRDAEIESATAAPDSEPASIAEASAANTRDPLPPVRIVFLPSRFESQDAEVRSLVDETVQAILNELRSSPYVDEVIVLSAAEYAGLVPASAGPLREDRVVFLAIVRRYDDAQLVEVSETGSSAGEFASIRVQHNRQGGWSTSGSSINRNSNPRFPEDPYSVGTRIAARIIDQATMPPRLTDEEDPAAVALDAMRSAEERLAAISRLGSEGLDSALIAAAVELGSSADKPELRSRTWSILRRSAYDAALIGPASYALLSDADPAVRQEAALLLGTYIDDSNARSALAYAADNDTTSTVSLAARMALMSRDDREVFRRETLLDRSLTPAERLAPMEMLNDAAVGMAFNPAPDPELDAEAVAYAEIILATDMAQVRSSALSRLMTGVMPYTQIAALTGEASVPPEVTEALVHSARSDDERSSRLALNMLTSLAADEDIRAILEGMVQEDPAFADRPGVAEALERAGNPRP